ncbi:hypothetical protein ABT341_00095 [Pseudonocardia alni]|uniref:hypothetical protein n=1 Tax=Pseudonocardia alni TaxID=33907 RepID=UPI003316F56F
MTDEPLGLDGVREVGFDEGRVILDTAARNRLGMSGAAFLAAYDSGQLDHLDCCDVEEVAGLIPFVRHVSAPLSPQEPR